jgi:heme-degrading monooxygenase HmoA
VSDPIAVILRFNGDPDALLERFEQARKSWIEAQDEGYNPPAFFAICKAEQGIVVVSGWETDEDHKAFERMGPHLQAVGMGMPDDLEHRTIARLGWDPAPAEAS